MPVGTEPPTIAALADALAAATPQLDDGDRRTALAIYGLLSHGSAVSEAEVAESLGLAESEVSKRVGKWPGVYRDEDGAIVGFWGLARDPLDPRYRLRPSGSSTDVYAWCAWDTLFLPALLGQALDVSASDSITGQAIRLRVTPSGVECVDPSSAVVTFLVPAGPFDSDVVASFCHKVLFFADQDGATEWIAGRTDELFTLSVEDAFQVGQLVTAANYGDALASDWALAHS